MHRQLEVIDRELDAAAAEARSLFARASGRLTRQPAAGKWSAAECLEHLAITNRAFLSALVPAVERLRSRGARATGDYRMEPAARFLRWMIAPPYRIKVPTTPPFVPAKAPDPAAALASYLDYSAQLRAVLREADGLALDSEKIESPFSNRLRYNVYSAFRLIVAHDQRHLFQARHAAGEAG